MNPHCNLCDNYFQESSKLNSHLHSCHNNSFDKYLEASDDIIQVDGNDTLTSIDETDSSILSDSSLSLPQLADQFSSLPTIYSANARSVFPKFNDLVDKLQNSRIDIAQISETWQDLKKKEHNDKIDVLKNRYGYIWYSFARSKYRDEG